MKKIVFIILCFALQACSTVASVDRSPDYYGRDQESPGAGLLAHGDAMEDDAHIRELLNYQLILPKKSRMAVIKLSQDSYWRFYSNDFNELNDALVENFIMKLRESERLYDASFLPAMLVPEQRTIPVLREAAARFQADLLLAYRSACNSYQKFRFISPNENKSYCTVEAVVLDIRSGVIAKSVVSTQDYTTVKLEEDTNFAETIKKAELETVAKALGEVAVEVTAFLDKAVTMK